MDDSNVSTTDVESADDFIEYISPLGKPFGGGYFPSGMLFRGHADSRWPLIPTGLREDAFLEPGEWTRGSDKRTNADQIQAEARLLREFFKVADCNGLPLPEDSQRLRRLLDTFTILATASDEWPPDELLSLMAIAQHHRLPTRLLDWTTKSYVAAYFAASTAATWHYSPHAHARRGATHLCVWALSASIFEVGAIMGERAGPRTVEIVTTPAAGNPNLRAQGALFLVHRPKKIDLQAPVDRRPWDKLLRESFTFMKSHLLYQVRLPIEQAPRLLRLLAHLGVDAASVYPGFDGVFAAMTERKFWECAGDFQKVARAPE